VTRPAFEVQNVRANVNRTKNLNPTNLATIKTWQPHESIAV